MPTPPTLPLHLLPKIVFPSSILPGPYVTLQFLRQPRKVPFVVFDATRHDNVASSGVQESVWERTDTFFEGEMEFVFAGADIAAWQAFMASALQGIPFDFFTDSTSGSFQTYYSVDKKWQPAYKSAGQYTFKMQWRLYVTWP